jgi:large subunit ribosomal protein L17
VRHRVRGRHLGRTAEHRRALSRNLVIALFEHGRIRTTDPKAREVRPLAEKLITLGKRGDLHARRLAARVVGSGTALDRLFGPIAQRFASRPGGYTRIVKAGRRHGDAAPIAFLELLDEAPRVVRAPGAGADEEDGETRGRGRGARGEAAESGKASQGARAKAAREKGSRAAKRAKGAKSETAEIPERGGKRGKAKGGTPGTGAETARGSTGKGAAGGKPAKGGGGGKETAPGPEGEGRGKAGRSR